MKTNNTHAVPARLEGIRRRFERWRRAHRARSRLPEGLWAASVQAALAYGIHRVSRALRLDYYALKKRAEQQSAVVVPLRAKTGKAGKGARAVKAVKAGRAAGTTFLELPAAMPAGGCQYTLELEDADGAKMRVHVQGVQAPDLATLSRSFWNPTL
jgi:hypothetical protein